MMIKFEITKPGDLQKLPGKLEYVFYPRLQSVPYTAQDSYGMQIYAKALFTF